MTNAHGVKALCDAGALDNLNTQELKSAVMQIEQLADRVSPNQGNQTAEPT